MSTVRIHASSAKITFQTGSDTRDDDLVSYVKLRNALSGLLNDTDAFVAKNATLGYRREIALQDVKIGPADGGSCNSYDRIPRILDRGTWLVFPPGLAGTVINQRFHCAAASRGRGTRSG
jgi:hypothetical protein